MTDRVTIAIPTFRRPKNLQRLLEAVARLDGDADIAVLVADNDAQGQEGAKLCARLAPDYRFPLKAVIAAERGIAQVRNTLVREALADPHTAFIAMIDDDEWPVPSWITRFLSVQHATGADVVHGSILFNDPSGAMSRYPPRHRPHRHVAGRGQFAVAGTAPADDGCALVRSGLRPDRRRGPRFLPAASGRGRPLRLGR